MVQGEGHQFTTTEVEEWNKNIFPIFIDQNEKRSVWRAFCAYGYNNFNYRQSCVRAELCVPLFRNAL